MGSVAFTASKPHYHRGFYPLMPGVTHVPFPDPYRPILERKPGEDYGETVVRFIEEEIFGHNVPGDEIAGVLVEPIQGEGGYLIPPDGFFPALRKLCNKYGILLIADEVQSGMGRTGKWWAIEHFGVEFVKDKSTKEPNEAIRDMVEKYGFQHGLLLLGCGKSTIRLAPPLCITKQEIDEGLEIFEYVITMAEQEQGLR